MSVAKEMRELIERWKKSGQSLTAFGRQEGVSYSRLVYWRRKLESGAATGKSGRRERAPEFVPVEVTSDPMPTESKFEVWLANGVSLDVTAGFDEDELRRLVGVLQSC